MPIVTITLDQILQSESNEEDPITFSRKDPQEVYNTVRLDFKDRTNFFNDNPVEAKDEAHIELFGPRIDNIGTGDEFSLVAYANVSVTMQLRRNISIMNTYTWKMGPLWGWIDPMDIVNIPDPCDYSNTISVRIITVEDDEDEEDDFFVCSRNNMLKENDNKFWQAIDKNKLKEKLKTIPHIICQAELYGIGIQKNKLGIPDVDLAVFNMVDRQTRRRLSLKEMLVISEMCKIPLVPLNCIIYSFDWTFEKLQEYADIMKYEHGEVAEGIVIRPCEPFFSNVLKDIWSVKVINREYKL